MNALPTTNMHVSVGGVIYPARKSGNTFYLPGHANVAVGDWIEWDDRSDKVLYVKSITHATVVSIVR